MQLLRLRSVLVATDLEPSSDEALISADRLAAAAGAKLHVVHVAGCREGTREGTREGALDAETMAIATVLGRAGIHRDSATVHLTRGDTGAAINELASRIDADVVVLGPHRESSRPDEGLGSTAYAVAAHGTVPCLVIARPLQLPLRRVLVAVDASGTARGALAVALCWSSALRARASGAAATSLVVLHVDRSEQSAPRLPDPIERDLDAARRDAGDWAGVAVRGVATSGHDVAECIARYASSEESDLLIVGTRAPGAEGAAPLGSVAAALVRRPAVPMLLVPPGIWSTAG